MSCSERRRYGFKLSSKDKAAERQLAKQKKWDDMLARSDVSKLRVELQSMERAAFLVPQQKQRKVLVERMIRDLEKREQSVENVPASGEVTATKDMEGDLMCSCPEEDMSFVQHVDVTDGAVALRSNFFTPRALRKRCCDGVCDDELKKRVKKAEDALLANDSVGGDVEDFLNSL